VTAIGGAKMLPPCDVRDRCADVDDALKRLVVHVDSIIIYYYLTYMCMQEI